MPLNYSTHQLDYSTPTNDAPLLHTAYVYLTENNWNSVLTFPQWVNFTRLLHASCHVIW